MTAKVAQTPPSDYVPEGFSDCMVECLECGIEWGWGAQYDRCQQMADDHNKHQHGENKALGLIDEVLKAHEGEIGTHYEGCWKYHAGCLAVVLRDILEKE